MRQILLLGRLGKKPEKKETKEGDVYAKFSIAVPTGKDKVEWYDCTAFKKTATLALKYLEKGSRVIISGTPTIQSWTDKDGNKRKTFSTIVNQLEFMSVNQFSEHTSDDEHANNNTENEVPTFDENSELPF